MNSLTVFFDHHIWANCRVIAACKALSVEQLSHSDPGTYGTVHATLLHLVRSDERYLTHLTGTDQSIPETDHEVSLSELEHRARRSGEGLRELARNLQANSLAELHSAEKVELIPAEVILLQAIYHAHEHRTHVNTLLGQLGIHPAPISAWDYYDEVLVPGSSQTGMSS